MRQIFKKIDFLILLVQAMTGKTDELYALLSRIDLNPPPDQLLTTAEAADFLRVTSKSVIRMRDSGEIKDIRVRGSVFYSKNMLIAYLNR